MLASASLSAAGAGRDARLADAVQGGDKQVVLPRLKNGANVNARRKMVARQSVSLGLSDFSFYVRVRSITPTHPPYFLYMCTRSFSFSQMCSMSSVSGMRPKGTITVQGCA